MDLLPPEAIGWLARILTDGAEVYGERNWEKGMGWERAYAACQRHLLAWHSGEDEDPESGNPHLAHAMCNLAFLITWTERGVGTDYRPKTTTI